LAGPAGVGKMKEIRIDLGGGLVPRPGHINIDLIKEADIVHDLNSGLPMKEVIYMKDGKGNFKSVDVLENVGITAFAANHLLEHLSNIIPLMNDCYEALTPGGVFEISTPHAGTKEWYQDPTHVKAFVKESFLYFAKDSPFKKEQKEYGITARFNIDRAERGKGVDKWQLFVTLYK